MLITYDIESCHYKRNVIKYIVNINRLKWLHRETRKKNELNKRNR